MSITEITELILLISAGLGLVVSVFNWVKELKTSKLKTFIEEKMVEAESRGLSGEEKLKYVLDCSYEKYGKSFIKLEQSIINYIDECIEFSKKINYKK